MTTPTHHIRITPEQHHKVLQPGGTLISPPSKNIAYRVELEFHSDEMLREHAEALEEMAEELRDEYRAATENDNE